MHSMHKSKKNLILLIIISNVLLFTLKPVALYINNLTLSLCYFVSSLIGQLGILSHAIFGGTKTFSVTQENGTLIHMGGLPWLLFTLLLGGLVSLCVKRIKLEKSWPATTTILVGSIFLSPIELLFLFTGRLKKLSNYNLILASSLGFNSLAAGTIIYYNKLYGTLLGDNSYYLITILLATVLTNYLVVKLLINKELRSPYLKEHSIPPIKSVIFFILKLIVFLGILEVGIYFIGFNNDNPIEHLQASEDQLAPWLILLKLTGVGIVNSEFIAITAHLNQIQSLPQLYQTLSLFLLPHFINIYSFVFQLSFFILFVTPNAREGFGIVIKGIGLAILARTIVITIATPLLL